MAESHGPPGPTGDRRVVLLRHGRTAWNLIGRAQGHGDVPLDEVGHAQAEAVAPLVAALRPSRLVSSDLTRAAQTAAYVGHACGLEVQVDPRLREFDVGERQGLTWAESVDRFPWIADGVGLGERLAKVPGAETDADVLARFLPALEDAAASVEPGGTVVVVTHGGSLRVGMAGVLGWDDGVARTLGVLENCHWATLLLPSGGGARRLLAYGVGDFASSVAIG